MTSLPFKALYAGGFTVGTYYVCAKYLDLSLSESNIDHPATLGLSLANLAVFLNSRRLASSRHFINSLFSPSPSMTLACFNHAGFGHLAMNMLALNSFGPMVEERMGSAHFLAFYLSCGTVSSLASLMYKARMGITIPSVGASGAVCGVIGASAHCPGVHVSPIFLPLSMPIEHAFPSLVAMDLIGLVRGGSPFDHAAHLGGSLSGYFGFNRSFHLWHWMQGTERRRREPKRVEIYFSPFNK